MDPRQTGIITNIQGDICNCVIKNREEGESQREWFKRSFCMFHWMQTDYYRNKLNANTTPNIQSTRSVGSIGD